MPVSEAQKEAISMGEDVSFVIRKFDDLGRIVIPKEIRRKLNLLGGKVDRFPMHIYEQDGKIILEKAEEE